MAAAHYATPATLPALGRTAEAPVRRKHSAAASATSQGRLKVILENVARTYALYIAAVETSQALEGASTTRQRDLALSAFFDLSRR